MNKNTNGNKMGAAATVAAVLVALAVVATAVALYQNALAVQFHLAPTCGAACTVHIVPDAVRLSAEQVAAVEAATQGGRILDPTRNQNNASGTRTVSPDELPAFVAEDIVPQMRALVADTIGTDMRLRGGDVFARTYEEGDFLNWHYDNNYSRGARVTAILVVSANAANTSEVQYMEPVEGNVEAVPAGAGAAMLYHGDKVYHRVTRQGAGGRRTVFIFPFYEDPRFAPWGGFRDGVRKCTYALLGL